MADEMKKYEEKEKDRQLCLDVGIPEAEVDCNKYFEGVKEEVQKRQENNQIMCLGYRMAFAIALHSFPEGLVTFVPTIANLKMGWS
jgi:zinc transporter ZupT